MILRQVDQHLVDLDLVDPVQGGQVRTDPAQAGQVQAEQAQAGQVQAEQAQTGQDQADQDLVPVNGQ